MQPGLDAFASVMPVLTICTAFSMHEQASLAYHSCGQILVAYHIEGKGFQLNRPWEAPEQLLADAGVELGVTYPHPVVSLSESEQHLKIAAQVIQQTLAASIAESQVTSHHCLAQAPRLTKEFLSRWARLSAFGFADPDLQVLREIPWVLRLYCTSQNFC